MPPLTNGRKFVRHRKPITITLSDQERALLKRRCTFWGMNQSQTIGRMLRRWSRIDLRLGRAAARVFELLDNGGTLRTIVRDTKLEPALVRDLRDEWRDSFDQREQREQEKADEREHKQRVKQWEKEQADQQSARRARIYHSRREREAAQAPAAPPTPAAPSEQPGPGGGIVGVGRRARSI